MSARRNKAFTLTEMLVVISIIGVLVSMLLPAVQHAREAARRAMCQSGLSQCLKGVNTYDARKGFLPASRTYVSATVIQNWVVPVLPMLERQDLSDTIRSNGGDPTSVAKETIPILHCPDDPDIKFEGTLSYVVNGGRQNNTYTSGGTTYTNCDFLANGLFVDKAVAASPPTTDNKMSLDRVHDGVSTTIMMAENVIAGARSQTGTPSLSWAFALTQQNSQILWFPDAPGCAAPSPAPSLPTNWGTDFVGLNQDGTATGATPSDLARFARPASFHPGGFNVGFADASVRFMSESVDYKIYAVLMTSWGDKARDPSGSISAPDPAWQSPTCVGPPAYPGTKF